VCAKGEDHEAQLIREAAEQAGVPIMRNVELARGLHEQVAIDEYITVDFFQAVAELLRWAESIRRQRGGI
jgi:type III secretion protein U